MSKTVCETCDRNALLRRKINATPLDPRRIHDAPFRNPPGLGVAHGGAAMKLMGPLDDDKSHGSGIRPMHLVQERVRV